MVVELKECTLCKRLFPKTKEYFYRNKTAPDGLFPYCKECTRDKSRSYKRDNKEECNQRDRDWRAENKSHVSEYNKMYYERNSEKFYEKLKRWQEENYDRIKEYAAKKQHHKISKHEWSLCKEYFNNKCAYCGVSIKEHYVKYKGNVILGDFHKEHVDDNGANDLSNCVPSCKKCNSLKGSYDFSVWFSPENPIWSQDRYNHIMKWLNEDYKLYR